jgi:transposase
MAGGEGGEEQGGDDEADGDSEAELGAIEAAKIGQPQHDWQRRRKVMEPIFSTLFPGWKRSYKRRLVEAGIPASDISRWRRRWFADNSWRPWNFKSARGDHNRKIPPEVSQDVVEWMTRCLNAGKQITTVEVTVKLKEVYQARKGKELKICKSSVHAWLRDQGFRWRRAHIKRRTASSPERDKAWEEEIDKLLKTVPRKYIINVDETCWWFYPQGRCTWAPRGEECVQLLHDGNEKANFTAVACVTAEPRKLPMQFIAKGKSKTTARNFGDLGHNWRAFSESGWSTKVTFPQFLRDLRRSRPEYAEKRGRQYVHKLHVILDVYAVHKSPEVLKAAERLGVVLHFIPAGQTDHYQPLDRAVFGVLKAISRRLYREFFAGKAEEKVDKPRAAQFLMEAWEQVKPEVLRRAWLIYDP